MLISHIYKTKRIINESIDALKFGNVEIPVTH